MTAWHRIAQDMAADLEAAAAGIDSDDVELMCDSHDLIVGAARHWRHEIWPAELADSELTGSAAKLANAEGPRT